MTPVPGRLLAGEVGRPHGISGEVYVVRISDDPHRFESGRSLEREDGTVVTIESARGHHERLLVKFEGIDDRDAADSLRGPLYVSADELRDLEDDEFWPHDLIGCTVVDSSGAAVGTIEDVVPGVAQDLLQVATDAGPKLVPLVDAIVREIDVSAKRVVIYPPPGLLD